MSRPAHRLILLVLAAILAGSLLTPAGAGAGGGAGATRVGRVTHGAEPSQASYDARRPLAPERALAAAELRARSELGRSLGQGVFDLDPRTGTVRVLARLDGFLTSPSSATPTEVVMDYMRVHRSALGLDLTDLRTFVFVRGFADLEGTQHLSWVQRASGVQAFDNGLKASVTADGRIVTISGSPAHGLGAGLAHARPAVHAAAAIAAARAGRGGALAPQPGDTASMVLFHGGRSALAWQTLTRVSSGQVDLSVVDAASGRVLWQANMVKHETTGVGLAWESFPSTRVANDGDLQQPVTFPVYGRRRLAGNNAHVYLDVNDDSRASASDEIEAVSGFDWSVAADLNITRDAQNCKPAHACSWNRAVRRSWQTNRRQGAVQTYYYLNRFHDHLLAAPIGFTEGAGNFEADNTSGNGSDGDAVQAQVFDGAATANGLPDRFHYNNANMWTRPDGTPPIMQMYLFKEDRYSRGWPSANSGDDASIVYHEYTHGLSSRLVTYPNGEQALNLPKAGAMGEAWSDWYAMDLLVDEGWEADSNQPGEVKTGEYITGLEGIRYQAIDCPVGAPSGACPAARRTGSGGFTFGDYGDIWGAPEVHADGEIWAQALWDLRKALGVQRARRLITRGMMLSPPEPSFLDMRNSIVQADRVANSGSNADTIWRVFAHRGMGYFASVVDANDVSPVENFKVAPDCRTDPCGRLTGIVRDSLTGAPLPAVVVGLGGHTSGFPGASMYDVTGSDGRYSIPKVPHGTYRDLFVDRRGYDVSSSAVTVNQRTETVAVAAVRDWAADDGGATITKASPPDYTASGCGPDGAIDRSLSTGWGSDMPGPREIVVKLPRAVDVTSFGVDPGATCGDHSSAAVKAFDIYTKTASGSWILAWRQTDALPQGRLNRLVPSTGRNDVRCVRFVMKSNVGRNIFLDMSELSVRGSAA